MYQKCPICNGEGVVQNLTLHEGDYSIGDECPTCHGERIISGINGEPPSQQDVDVAEILKTYGHANIQVLDEFGYDEDIAQVIKDSLENNNGN